MAPWICRPGDYRLDDHLLELTFGEWEGFTYDDIGASRPGAIAAREADKWGFLPPGGESYAMLFDRIAPWLDAIQRPSVVVAHGGVGRVALVKLLGLERAESAFTDFPQDKVFLWRDGEGTWL